MKKMLALAGAGILALSLSGCGGGGSDESAAASTAEKVFNAMLSADTDAYCNSTIPRDGEPRDDGGDAFDECVTRWGPLLAEFPAQMKALGIESVKVTGATVDGNKASVGSEDLEGNFDKKALTEDAMELIKVDGKWYAIVDEW